MAMTVGHYSYCFGVGCSAFLPSISGKILEEFETDDGVPYWFDRRTGETFWERPLCDEEKVRWFSTFAFTEALFPTRHSLAHLILLMKLQVICMLCYFASHARARD